MACRTSGPTSYLWEVLFCVVSLNVYFVNGFNVDAFNYAVYGAQENSMFGFTVAVHKQGYNRGWVLVGAPEAQSQYQPPTVRFGGVVYRCRPDGDDTCQEIPFDRDGNQHFGNKEMDQKSGQWFGATLSTSGNVLGGPVVACAPRYVWYSKEMKRRDPVGTCFVSDSSFEKFEEYSPCRTSNWGYNKQGSCQAGFSAAINSAGDRLFVGGPGSYYWQGSVHQQSLETRPAVFQTREGKEQDDDSYLGYSTIVGDFLSTGEQGIAVGMPRGAELRGKVLLFTWNLTNYKNISSSQLGSYFGYSLAAADVDGDSKLDLIVGAPMHTEPNTEGKYDVGRVYVFYQGGSSLSFNKSSFIDGMNSKSRFGHSIASLGDMNQDGYEDFAVGAPYDGKNNRGAVYIYYGSSKGVLEKYGQVIYAEDMVSRNSIPVSTFGFSVTGGLDMDGNDYPDMAVGAYLSNAAFFFRSRPVVRVEAFVEFRTKNKQIDIKNKTCLLPSGQKAACTTIDFCIKYSGKGIPQEIRLNVQYILDTKKPNVQRMAFMRSNYYALNDTIILYKDRQDCHTEDIYIKNDIRDKLTPLEAEVKYSLIQTDRDSYAYGRARNPQSQLKPVLDLNLPPSRKDSINIQKNCGHDNICIPNLHVNVTKNVEKYLLDSNTSLAFDIIVSNLGEDSFETTLDFRYPKGVSYKKTEVSSDMHGILCSPTENNTISCSIGNPLPARKIAKFQIIFTPHHDIGINIAPTYDFEVHVNSSNPENEDTLEDNYSHITVGVWVDSTLEISGLSIPREIYLSNTTQYTSETIQRESDIGPQVTHVYTLKNKGPAPIHEAEMYFVWPWQTLAGDDLLYLLEGLHVPEGVTCDIPIQANYKHYQLDYNRKSVWERFQIDSSSHDMGPGHKLVNIESGTSITGVVGGTRVGSKTSKLDEEIASSSGDASGIFEKRYNESGQDSTGHISKAGETVYTRSEWRTVQVDGKPVMKWTNVTTYKDAAGRIIKTTYSSDESGTDQLTSSTNVDSFGQNRDGYTQQQTKPNIHYSSSGGERWTQEQEVSRKSSGGSRQFSAAGTQQPSSGSGQRTTEQRNYEEHSYTVGGGPREGGVSTTPSYDENQIISRHGSQETSFSRQGGAASSETDQQTSEERRRYQQRMEYEERLRQQSREEQQRQAGQNSVISEEERQYERRLKQEEEQRRRFQEELEKRRQETYEEQVRRQQQAAGGDSRRIQQQREEEIRRRQEEERRRQQEEERRRQEEEAERRRQYEIEERRRQEQERQRQWQQQQYGSTSGSRQQSGSAGSSARGGRTRTGYFDSSGNYHDESDASSAGRGGVVFNRTWTAEKTATIDDVGGGQGGQINFGQAAASGDGFRTQTIDLGMVGRGGSAGASGQQQASSDGGQRQWVTTGQRTRGGTFSGTIDGGISENDRYSSEWERTRWEDGSAPPYGRDNVATDRPDLSNHRGKRQIPEMESDIDKVLKCTATKCFYVKCVVGALNKDEFISVVLRSRLNVSAVRQLSTTQPVKLSSMMVARISKLPYIGKPKEQVLHSHEIFTDIPAGDQELTPQVVPLWIILLSAIAGTLILLLVILLLYKCGFFKRKRPSTAPERQPLRTNGYHPGD